MSDAAITRARSGLRELVDSTFFVRVRVSRTIEGEETPAEKFLDLECRELSLSVLLSVISELLRTATSNAIVHGTIIGKRVTEVMEAKEPADKRKAAAELVGASIPALLEILPHFPELIERILLDCIVESTPEDVKRIGLMPALQILEQVMKRLDQDETIKAVSGFFTPIGGMLSKATAD